MAGPRAFNTGPGVFNNTDFQSADAAKSENARKSGRNIDDVTIIRADQLNCFDMLNHRFLVIGKSDLEAWLSGPWSQTGKDAKLTPMGAAKKEGK